MQTPHIAVLQNEITECFRDIKNGTIVDCTVGFGSHSLAILLANPRIKMVCNDQDSDALEFSKKRLAPFADRVTFVKGNFEDVLKKVNISETRGVLADFGVSSFQLDNLERGFGFDSLSLDMRMDKDSNISAEFVVNYYDIDELSRIFLEYGELQDTMTLAKTITDARLKKPIRSSKELIEAVRTRYLRADNKFFAKLFQALRIEVNHELDSIKSLLKHSGQLKNCIIALISFHSLEDRLVKNSFKEWSRDCICPPESPKCSCGKGHKKGEIITKKPITPTQEEIRQNSRSRSSKLRIFRMY